MCQCVVFGYLGITFFSFYPNQHWCPMLSLCMFFIVLIGRFASTVGLVNFLRLFGHKPSATNGEMFFLCYAGFIRGAVAFGLVLRLENGINKSVIVTTSLTVVAATILIFGGTVQMIGECMFGKPVVDDVDESLTEPLGPLNADIQDVLEEKEKAKEPKVEEYEHPNFAEERELAKQPEDREKPKGCWAKLIRKAGEFDEKYLLPLLTK